MLDKVFFDEQLKRVLEFNRLVVMPELVSKWFTRNPHLFVQRNVKQSDVDVSNVSVLNGDNSEIICYCRKPMGESVVVTCQSSSCQIRHFHLGCLRLKSVPKRKWFCTDCRKLSKIEKHA